MYFLSQSIFFTDKLGAKRFQGFWGLRVPGNFAWAGSLVCQQARALPASEGIGSKKSTHDAFFIPRYFFHPETWSEAIAGILGTPGPRKLSMGRNIGLQASEGIASKKNKHDVFFIPKYFFYGQTWSETIPGILGTQSPRKLCMGRIIGLPASEGVASKRGYWK